jgi:hypothetical protein
MPLDETNGNLLRAKVMASLGAIQAQIRADEHQLRRKTASDVLDRLEKLIEEQQKLIPARTGGCAGVRHESSED